MQRRLRNQERSSGFQTSICVAFFLRGPKPVWPHPSLVSCLWAHVYFWPHIFVTWYFCVLLLVLLSISVAFYQCGPLSVWPPTIVATYHRGLLPLWPFTSAAFYQFDLLPVWTFTSVASYKCDLVPVCLSTVWLFFIAAEVFKTNLSTKKTMFKMKVRFPIEADLNVYSGKTYDKCSLYDAANVSQKTRKIKTQIGNYGTENANRVAGQRPTAVRCLYS